MRGDILGKMDGMSQRRYGTAGVQMKEETSRQRHYASTDGVTQDIPSTGTQTLHPRPAEELPP